jgi:hypothetical protein
MVLPIELVLRYDSFLSPEERRLTEKASYIQEVATKHKL